MEFESQVGDLTSVLKVDDRRREALKEQFEDKQALLLVDRYRFLNLAPCTHDQLRYMGYSKQLRHIGGAAANGVATTSGGGGGSGGAAASTSGAAQGALKATLNGRGVEINGFPMPDTDQMLPFKPTPMRKVTSHPVMGGKRARDIRAAVAIFAAISRRVSAASNRRYSHATIAAAVDISRAVRQP